MKFVIFLIPLSATILLVNGHPQPLHLSEEFIDSINQESITWKAGKNLHLSPSKILPHPVPKRKSTHDIPIKTQEVNLAAIPESFDAREAWPECPSIGKIEDEGGCSSGCCYGFSNKRSILNNCCDDCTYGCTEGLTEEAWYYWSSHGIVTGGEYGSSDGCKAYSFNPCDHYNTTNGALPYCHFELRTHECKKVCDEGSSLNYQSDLKTGVSYRVGSSVAEIQTEIMTYGPVEATFNLYQDFYTYQSGIYKRVKGRLQIAQGVKLVGWGVENGTAYWLAAHSWNEYWGEEGYFRILRGVNECSIESNVFAGIPIF